MRKTIAIALVSVLLPALAPAQEKIDLNVIHKIKTEELGNNSKVMELMHKLTDQYGPRLTNSPQYRIAGDWAVKQMQEWGLSNVRTEKFATPKDNPIPGWQLKSYNGAMVEPQYMPIIGLPVAWTGSTNGPTTGEAVLATIATANDMEKFHGKLAGKWVLTVAPPELAFPTTALATRYTPDQLTELATELIPTGTGGRGGRGGGRGGPTANMTPEELRAFQEKMRSYFKEEKVAGTITASDRGQSGTLFGGGASRRMDTNNVPQLSITAEHYNRIARLLQHNTAVKLMFDIKTEFDTTSTDSFNIFAEIPGTTKPQEVVMIGAHFDSWHYGTGATDNAAGSAVSMEVMRVLKALNLKMDRTVRIGLWGGEEQGLLGSRAYVKEKFADPEVMKPTPEHSKLSGYFNIDNGTGRIRGVYLQGNEMMRPIFEQWFGALKDLTNGAVTIRNTGGTDHLSFVAVGIPGFQFIQDPMDYNTRTHHSNMDMYDRIQAADMKQMAIVEAAFVYLAATRPEMLPRVDLPPPQPARGGRGGRGATDGN
jgi:carboxypeptidase Q